MMLNQALKHDYRAHRAFIETPRYTGAVYGALGWIQVGKNKDVGAGRYGLRKHYSKPKEDNCLMTLRRN